MAAISQMLSAKLPLYALFALLLCHGAAASRFPAFVSLASHHSQQHHDVMSRPSICNTCNPKQSARQHHFHSSLYATSEDNATSGSNTSKSARERGIYARPSAAIERGSGFFIPGLEGSQIRFIFGITVLIADAANHVLVGGQPGDWGQSVAEILAALYGALLLLQGSIELGVENGIGQGSSDVVDIARGRKGSSEDGDWGATTYSSDFKKNEAVYNNVQRMGETIASFTPATCFRFIAEDYGDLFTYSFCYDAVSAIGLIDDERLTKLALDAVSASKGGRVALPSDHPAAELLPESAKRCVLVQKVDGYKGSRACMIIGSDKLLPSYTNNDLRWIGQLAECYNNLPMGASS